MGVPSLALTAAIRRSQQPILWIALTYFFSLLAGFGMVHAQNTFALKYRDQLIKKASASEPSLIALDRGSPFKAAILDFAANVCLGAVPTTIMGLGVVLPFAQVTFRGWVGGIVSVDDRHQSRLRNAHEGAYYLSVLLLQLIPYSITGGAGVRLGLGLLLPKGRWGYPGSKRWLTLPAEGVLDVLRIYTLAVPLFLLASLFEFLAR